MADAEAMQGAGPRTPIADAARWFAKSFARFSDTVDGRFADTETTGFHPTELADIDIALTQLRYVCEGAFAVIDRAKEYGYGSATPFFRSRLGTEFTRRELQDHLARDRVPPLKNASLFEMFLDDWAEWFKDDMGKEGVAIDFMRMPSRRDGQPTYCFYLRKHSSGSDGKPRAEHRLLQMPPRSPETDKGLSGELGVGGAAIAAVLTMVGRQRRPRTRHMPHGA